MRPPLLGLARLAAVLSDVSDSDEGGEDVAVAEEHRATGRYAGDRPAPRPVTSVRDSYQLNPLGNATE